MDQQTIRKLVNKLIDDKLKLICEECRKKTISKKMGYSNFNISIQPSIITLDFDIINDNKENININKFTSENRVKASKSQAFDHQIFNVNISVIRPISQISSPTIKASRKKSMPFLKNSTQTTYEKILKAKR